MGLVLIFSENLDESTNEVIDWLHFLNQSYLRINAGDHIEFEHYNSESTEIKFKVRGRVYCSAQFQSVWYRKGEFYYPYYFDKARHQELRTKLEEYVSDEWLWLFKFFMTNMCKKKCLGDYHNREVDKLEVLQVAKNLEFEIPHTFLSQKKIDVENHLSRHNLLITKGVQDTPSINTKNTLIHTYTERLSKENIAKIPERFGPTLFQEEVLKRFEIRAFMMNETFFAMAIFSQKSSRTQTDFRKYDDARPNRTVPYQLDSKTQLKCRELAEHFGLNCCSFDFIVSQDNLLIFLEINPVGQFMMVSKPCNYNIEKHIAEFLIA